MQVFIDTLKKFAGPTQAVPAGANVTVRSAHRDDADALAALAALDSSHAPGGAVLVAEVDGELWAAVSLDDGHAIANPFRPSGELAFHLLGRARELRRATRSKPKRGLRVRRPATPIGASR
jgi:hypothetical protein